MRAKPRLNTPEEEAAIQRGIAQDPDSPELTDEFFANARPASEVMPPDMYAALTRRRGPGRRPAKVSVTLKLAPDVLATLRASGPGWQVRAGEVLAELAEKLRRA